MRLAYGFEGTPMIAAFFLGLVGAVAPCQFTGNLGAITLYGSRSLQEKVPWLHIIWFTIGKIVVFTSLGLMVWLLGREFQNQLPAFFPWIRKLVGPFLIFIGLFMIGIFKMKWFITLGKIPEKLKEGKLGAFFLGVGFSLGFCPTMFILFFVTLMPIVLSTSYGVVLPSIFAIGTSIPLIIAIFLIWYFDINGKQVKKKGRKVGAIIQKVSGWMMIVLGVFDTMTYWF